MKSVVFALLPLLLAGCFTAHVPEAAEWLVEWPQEADSREAAKVEVRSEVTRLSQLIVLAPYDQCDLQVVRADRTLASDPFNRFAALPSQILKGPALAALNAAGCLGTVVPATSSARAARSIELTVTSLRLDCTKSDGTGTRRAAEAAVSLLVLNSDRTIVGSARGLGAVDAQDGDYGAAFAKAFAKAVERAAKNL